MPRFSLDDIKRQKNFYRDSFRRAVVMLVVSVIISFVLIFFIAYLATKKVNIDYYATHGEVQPIKLIPLDAPNQSAEPLLPDDPPDEMSKPLGIN